MGERQASEGIGGADGVNEGDASGGGQGERTGAIHRAGSLDVAAGAGDG